MAKSRVLVGEDCTGQDSWEAQFSGSLYLAIHHNSVSVCFIDVGDSTVISGMLGRLSLFKKISLAIVSGKYSVSFHWVKAVVLYWSSFQDRCGIFSKDRKMPGSLHRAIESNDSTVHSDVHSWLRPTGLQIPFPVMMD